MHKNKIENSPTHLHQKQNTMTDYTENVHIYLQKESDHQQVLAGASPQEKYIILMNDTLQFENKTKDNEVKRLEFQVENLENEVRKLESGRTYMKGLLKNFHGVNKWLQEISNNEQEMLVVIQKDLRQFKWKATRHLRLLEACLAIFAAYCYEFFPFFQFFQILMVLMVVVAFQESTLQNLVIPTFESKVLRINELRAEINKMDKTQDYLHEFINQQ